MSSFWYTTLPGRGGDVLAQLEGLVVGHADRELAVAALDVVQQVAASPSTRFFPPVSKVAFSTSGLVSAKLVGANASTNWRVKNSTFLRSADRDPQHWRPASGCSEKR